MNIHVFFTGGIANDLIRTIYKAKAPLEIRVGRVIDEGNDTAEVDLYRVMSVEPMPIASIGMAAHYAYQGTRPSAWSLVDFTL